MLDLAIYLLLTGSRNSLIESLQVKQEAKIIKKITTSKNK